MRIIAITATLFITIILRTNCHAGCNCADWMNKGGYCVDYVKTKIPSFPIPQNKDEITTLKNRDIFKVTAGDAALFNFSNYWHVAYVEKVHLDQHGNAIAIDVSEMNFGGQLSFLMILKTNGIKKVKANGKEPSAAVSPIITTTLVRG